ncbi:desumoylating isopeptidase 1-like protein [Babesia ovata]|uniref:Desumoylating isopeptidase 1-like protein n=1 Tax=Babesia ovata TaxID=189622 RepID=A0A2H6KFK1_9APIC|nr:desumoylating isopeptidase 1-like protein [Babesia ovata]GBE61766.1 desumoylating isopeptidase 1-like protein [Babesia ovata]
MSEESKDGADVTSTPVYLKVYDLSHGMASKISMPLLGFQMDGLWHTSIAVFGNEYLFGQGISYCSEARCEEMTNLPLVRKILLGETSITKEVFHEYIDSLKVTFSPESYHLLRWNCNHFTNTAADFLTGTGIPDEYVKMIERIEQSPSGKVVLGLIEVRVDAYNAHVILEILQSRPQLFLGSHGSVISSDVGPSLDED